jgi:hypothetical protein
MLNNVHVDAGSKGFAPGLLCGALHNVVNCEIKLLGMLSVQQCDDDPNFVRNFCAIDE